MTPAQANELLCCAAIQGPSWVYHRRLDAADRDAFDILLIATNHPLIYEPGSQWYRFEKLARADYRFVEVQS